MPRALITGITGQDGLYLSELLVSKGYEVYGLIRGQNNPKFDLVRRTIPEVKLVTGDLTDLSSLLRALNVAQPDEVYNLGAISFVAYSWENAHLTTDVTGKGVLNILEAIRLYAGDDASKVRFYQASSSEMFGKVQEVPQRESTLLWPRSPYGVAKVFGHYMTINYRESYGMHASSGILFNHESPRRGPEFVTRKVSQAVARIKLGMQDSMFKIPADKKSRVPGLYSSVKGKLVPDTSALGAGYGEQVFGGYSISTTAGDYALFAQMLLNKGELDGVRILSRKTIETMTSNSIGDLFIFNPFKHNGIMGDKFGLGFGITSRRSGARGPRNEGSFAWGGFFGTTYWADPKAGLVCEIMTQQTPNSHGDLSIKVEQLIYQSLR